MNDTNVNPTIKINLLVALPSMAQWVFFDCGVGGRFAQGPGKTHQWVVPLKKVESCHAQWGHSEATFNAFDAQSDLGHVTVYWLVKLDGFYRSWDNFNWGKRASWQH